MSKITSFFQECVRVFQVTKKPSMEELKITVKVSAIGMLIIGVIGFAIHVAWQVF